MGPMSSGARIPRAAGHARWALLVLAVLTGLLGMHALSPGGMPAVGEHAAMTVMAGHHRAVPPENGHRAAPVHRPGDSCRQPTAPDSGGPSMRHDGGTCTAAGVATGYAPPALPAGPADQEGHALAPRTAPQPRHSDGRAPPDLAELQLLRI
ncbi:hypothetical protein GCM10018787_03210 [Streptomyces thermodiastaticus]|nr:hypothetical protein GCM10018787_03210 [Streptomyces thermodiastaticus]